MATSFDKTFSATGSTDAAEGEGTVLITIGAASAWVATFIVEIQRDADLTRTLADTDYIAVAEYTNSSDEVVDNDLALKLELPSRRRFRVRCSAYTSGSPRAFA